MLRKSLTIPSILFHDTNSLHSYHFNINRKKPRVKHTLFLLNYLNKSIHFSHQSMGKEIHLLFVLIKLSILKKWFCRISIKRWISIGTLTRLNILKVIPILFGGLKKCGSLLIVYIHRKYCTIKCHFHAEINLVLRRWCWIL